MLRYEDKKRQTDNTNFALLVAKHFSEPFKDSNGYGESIARLSNMLGGGVIVQRFGDLVRGRRSNDKNTAADCLVGRYIFCSGCCSTVCR